MKTLTNSKSDLEFFGICYIHNMLIEMQINLIITCIAKVVWLLDFDSPSSWITKLIFRPSPLELVWVLLTKALMVSGGTFEDCNEGCLSKVGWPRFTGWLIWIGPILDTDFGTKHFSLSLDGTAYYKSSQLYPSF